MASLKKEIKQMANNFAKDGNRLGLNLDYSVSSLERVEQLLISDFPTDGPRKEGYFGRFTDGKLFGLCSYLGEVVIRNSAACKWVVDEKDPQGAINMRVVSANGTEMFPGHRVMKRIQNGEEDNLYHYGAAAVSNYMKHDGEIPEDFLEVEVETKPWWKFW
jgi:hypothetical protein